MISCFWSFNITAQELVSKSYRVNDGLPSNETYSVIKDKKGFIWIASDLGITRFNGYTFKTFSEKEGLPENVVFKLYEDNYGRIWFTTLGNRVGYIKQDQITNLPEFAVIKKDLANTPFCIHSIVLDSNKTLWLGTIGSGIIYQLKYPYKEVKKIHQNKNSIYHINKSQAVFSSIYCQNNSNQIHLYQNKSHEILNVQHKEFLAQFLSLSKKGDLIVFGNGRQLTIFKNKKLIFEKQFENRIIHLNIDDKNKIWVGVLGGGVNLITNVLSSPKCTAYFKGISISGFTYDNEGGYWFSSLEKGIIYVPSFEFIVYGEKTSLLRNKISNLSVGANKTLYAHGFDRRIYKVTLKGAKALPFTSKGIFYNPKFPDLLFFTGDSAFIYNRFSKRRKQLEDENNKYYYVKNIIASERCMFLYSPVELHELHLKNELTFKLKKIDLIKDRINYVHTNQAGSLIWVATNKGLKKIDLLKNSSTDLLYIHPLLGKRIDKIIEDKRGNFWLLTHSNGLLVLKKNDELIQFNEQNGLLSDFPQTFFLEDETIWIGTTKGISKINTRTYQIKNFTFLNDFISREINDIKIKENELYLATNDGLFRFNLKELDEKNFKTPTFITSVLDQRNKSIQEKTELQYDENYLRFNFVGISYFNSGTLEYEYKMNASNWIKTKNLNIDYNDLAPGDYTFYVRAYSSNKNQSHPVSTFSFRVLAPFWKTSWFHISILACIILGVYFWVKRIIRQVKRKEKEKADIQILIAELEAKALRAQMNPHFIFNALNSIQFYILKNENKIAHSYLAKFAKLMRNILEYTKEEFIVIEKEIESLKLYIELEKLRFSDKFEFEINLDPEIMIHYHRIPTMILQPFIENAIIHGIAPLKDRKGKLILAINKIENQIICKIEDNGVGRLKSSSINKKKEHYHQSYGLSITKERTEKLKQLHQIVTKIYIEDKTEKEHQETGTVVTIILPLN
jgi:ligand-binding sensor domain-containing protein